MKAPLRRSGKQKSNKNSHVDGYSYISNFDNYSSNITNMTNFNKQNGSVPDYYSDKIKAQQSLKINRLEENYKIRLEKIAEDELSITVNRKFFTNRNDTLDKQDILDEQETFKIIPKPRNKSKFFDHKILENLIDEKSNPIENNV